MALIAWYKLDGNLVDEIGDNHFTYERDTGKLVSEAGKIGGCYKREVVDGGSDLFRSTNKVNFTGDFSFSLWAKATNSSSVGGFITHHNHSRNAGAGITIKVNSSNDYRISCNTGNGTSRTYNSYYGTTNIKDKWCLLTLVFIKETNNLSLWVDGVKEVDITYDLLVEEDYIDLFNWSTGYYTSSAYRTACSIGDVRIYDHALSKREILELAKARVLHYRFSGGYSDSSGYNNHATPSGHQTFIIDEGRNSCQFNGSGNLTTNRIFFDDLNQEWTSMAWVKITDGSVVNQQLNNFNQGNRIIHSAINGKALLYANSGVNDHYVYSTGAIPTNEWVHIAFVYRTFDLTCKIYLNGELNASSTNYDPTDIPHGFASSTIFGANYRGLLSDVRVYATALSPEDIREVYTLGVRLERTGDLLAQLDESHHGDLARSLVSWLPLRGNSLNLITGEEATNSQAVVGENSTYFNGSNAIISMPTPTNITNKLTMACWIKLNSTRVANYERACGVDGIWILYVHNSGNSLAFYGSGIDTRFPNLVGLRDNKWHQVAVVYDGLKLEGFVDGNSVGTLNKTGNLSSVGSTIFTIGNRTALDRGLHGDIKDVRVYDRVFSSEEMVDLYNGSLRTSPFIDKDSFLSPEFSELGITNGLVAYYPLNGNAFDYVNRNDGTVNVATIAEGMSGKSCYEFNGSSSHINCGDAHNLRDSLSICAWVNIPTTYQGGVVVKSDANGWANNSYVFMRSISGNARIYLSGGNGTQSLDFSGSDIVGKEWVFCCMSLSETNLTLYLNGNQYNTATRTVGRLNENNNPFYIGKGHTTTYFNGKIQNVRLYNRALTKREINIIYDLEKPDPTQMKIGTDSVYISGEFDETH